MMKFKEGFSELQAMHQLNIGKSIESFCVAEEMQSSLASGASPASPFFPPSIHYRPISLR
jgi:hypothetical protein